MIEIFNTQADYGSDSDGMQRIRGADPMQCPLNLLPWMLASYEQFFGNPKPMKEAQSQPPMKLSHPVSIILEPAFEFEGRLTSLALPRR